MGGAHLEGGEDTHLTKGGYNAICLPFLERRGTGKWDAWEGHTYDTQKLMGGAKEEGGKRDALGGRDTLLQRGGHTTRSQISQAPCNILQDPVHGIA